MKGWGFLFKMCINEHKKYTITIDPTPQQTKPSKNKIGEISNNLLTVTGLTINEVATYVDQPYGYTWSGGIFNGNPTNKNWKSQSVFGLDFDNKTLKITPEAVIQRFEEYKITPQLWYRTFSSTSDLLKFRVLLFMDHEISNSGIHNIITNGLKQMFPEADPACFNKARIFFGGKNPEVIHHQPIDTLKLFENLSILQISKDNGRTRSISKPLLGCSGGCEDFQQYFGEKQTFLYNNYRRSSFSPSSSTLIPEGKENVKIDGKIARSRIKILDQFLNGEWLYHEQLFGLATNLINVKGGRKLMKETMTKFNEQGITSYTENNFNILPYLNIINYPPQPIHTFSPYPEDSNLYDLVSEVKDKRGKIEIIEEAEKIQLEDAEEKFDREFQRVINSGEKGKIYLFKLPTAIGKTKMITSSMNCTIALPTNKLKNEVMDRMTIPCIKSPDPVIFNNDWINQRIQYFYSIGLPKKAVQIIHELASDNSPYMGNYDDISLAKSYTDQLELSKVSENTVITTHAKALFTQFKHDTLIFDEDPLNSLIQIQKMKISDLYVLGLTLQNERIKVNQIVDVLKNAKDSEVNQTPRLVMDFEEMYQKASETTPLDSNLFSFFSSSYFIKDSLDNDLIHYVVKKQLPKEKKIIILSATVNPFIYQCLFGEENVEVIEIDNVIQKGKIIQHTKRSCSRNSLNRYVSQVSNEVGEKQVITFKSFIQQFQNPVKDIYFGNCSGYNTMAGQDISVVGTPHKNNVEYFLLAKVVGVEFNTSDISANSMRVQKIEHNGFRFKFNSFENPDLRKIQLALIESDLIQAVGRARTLRTSATVEVYSNFPLKIATQFVY